MSTDLSTGARDTLTGRPADRAPSPLATAWGLPETRWSALALALFALGGAAQLLGLPAPVWWACYLACCAAGGWEPALAGLRALRERTLDVDVLMVLAAIAAAAIGEVLDAALLVVIFATSGALEAVVTRRTAQSVDALLALAPERAARATGAGEWEDVAVDSLVVGDVVLVRPGMRLGADGIVVDGESEVDEASVTGEPLPVPKEVGAEVFAGTVNGTGALRVRVTRPAGESVVARVAAVVEAASATKARRQLFIETVEQRYSVLVVLATLALLVVPLVAGEDLRSALLRAMTFMVVASPCALVLATMPPLLAGIATAGRHGVLVRSAVALEALRDVDVVAFDKTGTLTYGRPEVREVLAPADLDRREVLRLAACAELPSEHPVGLAVVRTAREQGLRLSSPTDFAARPGTGVRARVDGSEVRVRRAADRSTAGPTEREALDSVAGTGDGLHLVEVDGRVVGALVARDAVRPSARGAVARLGCDTVLLSGDRGEAARRVADEVGIGRVHAGVLPEEKAAHVDALRAEGRRVAFVGDGINDAPAMATADVAVAFGPGVSDLAVETADVVVVRDDLALVPALLRLAARAHGVIVANLVLASAVIVALVAWDLVGDLPLPLGVAGHEGSTVLVALNGLRLLRRRVWEQAA